MTTKVSPLNKKNLRIKHVSLKSLVPYARNSRTHSDEQIAQIAASIKEFGWTNPILVDGDNGVIAGHGRILAARQLGITSVPVIELSHLTDAQKKAPVIADNKLALNAGWDTDLLKVELQELDSLGFDLALTGFEGDDLAPFFNEVTEGLTDEDAVPDVPGFPGPRPG